MCEWVDQPVDSFITWGGGWRNVELLESVYACISISFWTKHIQQWNLGSSEVLENQSVASIWVVSLGKNKPLSPVVSLLLIPSGCVLNHDSASTLYSSSMAWHKVQPISSCVAVRKTTMWESLVGFKIALKLSSVNLIMLLFPLLVSFNSFLLEAHSTTKVHMDRSIRKMLLVQNFIV